MSDKDNLENDSIESQSIDDILREFQAKREKREKSNFGFDKTSPNEKIDFSSPAPPKTSLKTEPIKQETFNLEKDIYQERSKVKQSPIEPVKENSKFTFEDVDSSKDKSSDSKFDFSAFENNKSVDDGLEKKDSINTTKNEKTKAKKREKAKKEQKQRVENIDSTLVDPQLKKRKIVLNKKQKKIAIAVGAAFMAVVVLIVSIVSSNLGYVKEYQKKYPKVTLPDGILEEYCDAYGQNQEISGHIKIEEIGLDSLVSNDSFDRFPTTEISYAGSEQFNYVVYLDSTLLESHYGSADAYNQSSTVIEYSNLTENMTFRVIGAFYVNTKAKDDNGYIFPYNVTEKMTAKSYRYYFDSIKTRSLYSTGITLTRDDTLLTISCPTSYHKDFRFVVYAVMRDDLSEENKPKATTKKKVHYPQVIYDLKKEENPYRFSKKWYPNIYVSSEKTSQQSIKDYE